MTDYLEVSTISKLARMVANSSAFQQEIAKYSEQEANAHIHRWMALNPNELPRPFAIISVDDSISDAGAGGDKDSFASGESLIVWLSTLQDEAIDGRMTLDWFWEWIKQVRNDVLSLSSVDDNLSISQMRLEKPPTMTHELSGNEKPTVDAMWRVELKGYLFTPDS